MKVDKKAINYYYSFFEVSKELNQKQFYQFNMAIYEVMFFEKHIDEISFDDAMLTILWKSVKHSIKASVDGYCTKKSIPYDECFDPLSKPLSNNEQGEGQEKGQEQEQLLENEFQGCWRHYTLNFLKKQGRGGGSKKNAFNKYKSLRGKYSQEQINALINSEINKLIGHKDLERVLTLDNMKQIHEDGVVERVEPIPIQSFKQQDAQKTDNALDAFLEARDKGFDLRNVNSEAAQDVEVIER